MTLETRIAVADASDRSAAQRRLDRVVPVPHTSSLEGGFLALPSQVLLSAGGDAAAAGLPCDLLAESMIQRGIDAAVVDDARVATVLLGRRDALPELTDAWVACGGAALGYLGIEGYALRVTDSRVLVIAETAAGVFYGTQTLLALLADAKPFDLPICEIIDRPALELRGYMQDFGRGMTPTLERLKTTVDRLAALKLNAFYLYLEDAFHFASHPDIGAGRDRIEPDEVRDLVRYAASRNVRIIPIIECLGHMENTLALPAYRHLREGDGQMERQVINPAHPETMPLLTDLLGDLMDCFSDPYIGVGGDETFGLGRGASAPLAERIGRGTLYTNHMRLLRDLIHSRGRVMSLWTDQFEPGFFAPFGIESIAADQLETFPRDVVLNSWHYNEVDSFDFGDRCRELGFPLVVQGAVDDSDLFPPLRAAAANARSFMAHAHRLEALGGICSLWHAGPGQNTLPENSITGIAYFAECMWSTQPRPWETFLPSALRALHGDNGEALAPGHRTLSTLGDAIEWGRVGLRPAAHTQFFAPVEARHLGDADLDNVTELRRRLEDAAVVIANTRGQLRRSSDLLDSYALALTQALLLTDSIVYRHRLASPGAAASLDPGALADRVRDIAHDYARLHSAGYRPVNLAPNLAALGAVEDGLRARALANAGDPA